ncbi:hypothetical protein RSAG8_13813, partial [Rhizoctonia solani AG-8 WAC10335]
MLAEYNPRVTPGDPLPKWLSQAKTGQKFQAICTLFMSGAYFTFQNTHGTAKGILMHACHPRAL